MLKDSYIILPFALCGLILLFGFSAYYVSLADVSHLLIIHFDSFRGIDFLGSGTDVLGILFAGLAILFINIFIASGLYDRHIFLSYLAAFFTIPLEILILIAIAVIIANN